MSGIVGVLNTRRAPLDAARLSRMTAAMAFRGPDAQHTWAGHHVGLGHTLLRTTFESAREVQPCSLDAEVWIAADARIDGRAALLRQLRDRGREVTGDVPDVELILHAYRVWGDTCLDHLIGDFAFVLWDGRQERLLAARDQLGVAQLQYAHGGDVLLVSNTLHSLLLHPGVGDALDEQMLADVAVFGVPLDDDATGYAAIRRVPPGHKLTADRWGVRVERYWTRPRPARIRYRRPEDYAEHFRLIFDEAVGDRLRADRAGTHLSGGMDSTSIAATAQHCLHAAGRPFDLRAYSIEYPSLIPDEEGRLAALVAGHSGIPIDVLDGADYLDAAPAADPAWVPPEPGAVTLWVMEEVCRRTATFARVLLTGYGGDPLLAAPDLAWHRAFAALRHGNWKWPLRRLAGQFRPRRRVHGSDPVPAWVNPVWAGQIGLGERAARFRRRSRREQVGLVDAPLWRALFAWADAGYNGRPLSIRFPFFDVRLLEFVLAIPPTPWLDGKHLLRAAMGDRLPDVVRARPKTVMPGDVALERRKQSGVPDWQIELIAAPEMSAYVDTRWLRAVRSQPPAAQAEMWAAQRPPVELAYWLRHRRRWDQDGGSSSLRTGGLRATLGR
ncbi:MAG: asparagine synthetase B family protein [Acidimicrobiales bacterium]